MANASSSSLHGRDAIVVGRVPALPIATARALYASAEPFEELRRHLDADPTIAGAIRLASPSLYGSLRTWLAGANPKNKRTRIGVLGYVLRMATRCTPFGVFAGVGSVETGERTTLQVGAQRIAARPDARWIAAVGSAFAEDPAGVRRAIVVANDLVIERGDALYVMDDRRARRVEIGERTPVWRYDAVHVRLTEAVRWVRHAAAAALPFAELETRVAERFSAAPEIARRLLIALLDAGVLRFMHGSSIGDALADLVAAASDVAAGESMHAIPARIAAFEAEAGRGVRAEDVAALDEHLQRVARVDGPAFGVDAVIDFGGALNAGVLADAELLAGAMLADGDAVDFAPDLRRFIERYESLDRVVPLLELVDDGFAFEPSPSGGETRPARANLLASLAARAVREGSHEIELDAATFDRLFPGLRTAPLRQSCEIGFTVCARDRAALDTGEYRIVPTPGANADGVLKSTGRFAPLLGPAFAARAAHLRRPADGALVAELDYRPLDVRAGNLIARQLASPYVIADAATRVAPGAQRISPADIVIGVEEGRLVAYARALGRRIEIVEHYLLETGYFAPPHMRLLARIGRAHRRTPRPFDWGSAARALPWLPRVRFERIILSVARWIVPRAELSGDIAVVRATIERWRSAWRLPRWVYLTDRDVRLLLDLDAPLAYELLCDQVPRYRGDHVLFEEMLPAFEEQWLEREGEPVAHEFVASFAVAATTAPSVARDPRDLAPPPSPLGPASRWTYVKLYASAGDLSALARDVVPRLVAACGPRVDRWFFLRYRDPLPHLRLRLHAVEGEHDLSAHVCELLEPLVHSGRIARYGLDTYRQEPERFGGRAALDPVERLVCADSRRVVEALARRDGSETTLAFALRTLAPFVRAWFVRFEAEAWLRIARERIGAAEEIDYDLVRRTHRWLEAAADGAEPGELAAIAELEALERSGDLTRPSGYVLGALIHVHCNRAGVEYADEPALEAHLLRALTSLIATHSRQDARDVAHERRPSATDRLTAP